MNKQQLSDELTIKAFQAVSLVEAMKEILNEGLLAGVVSPTVARIDLEMFSCSIDQLHDYALATKMSLGLNEKLGEA